MLTFQVGLHKTPLRVNGVAECMHTMLSLQKPRVCSLWQVAISVSCSGIPLKQKSLNLFYNLTIFVTLWCGHSLESGTCWRCRWFCCNIQTCWLNKHRDLLPFSSYMKCILAQMNRSQWIHSHLSSSTYWLIFLLFIIIIEILKWETWWRFLSIHINLLSSL